LDLLFHDFFHYLTSQLCVCVQNHPPLYLGRVVLDGESNNDSGSPALGTLNLEPATMGLGHLIALI
jgi:hypothetical protein